MNKVDFINSMVGVQYINRGYSLDGCDCFGLVYLYYKHVHGFDINLSDEYLNYEDFLTSFTVQLAEWEEVDQPKDGDCCFVCFNGDIPTHCGIMISKNEVLHSQGDPSTNIGQVSVWKLGVLKRVIGTDVRYYRPKVNHA